MIPHFRRKGFIQLSAAAVLTSLLAFLIVRRDRPHASDGYVVLLLFLMVACWVLWMLASYTLAKAKGYDSQSSSGMFVVFLVLGFCFMPIMMFAFPVIVLFGLKDKTRRRQPRV
jgi:peptidoglycan biosynthesis protein MviN/MurJ (putative lipid II flippase)